MRRNTLPIMLGTFVVILIVAGLVYRSEKTRQTAFMDSSVESAAPSGLGTGSTSSLAPTGIASPGESVVASPVLGSSDSAVTATSGNIIAPVEKASNLNPDLTTNANGLSKATVIMTTNLGVIKYKFYPKDAPNTVNRMIELMGKGFYNGLTFHRVVPGFVIQGGDPLGNGTGGSGQKLKAEFNNRRHIEGTVAMARAADPDSADSQFYICLGTHPHLDKNYTVFGQVVEGMDVVRKIKIGDKMLSVLIE